jgi:nitroreductase / dihydropteridine reductase
MDLIHHFNWRYVFNPNSTHITPEKLEYILDIIRSSGSSFGFMPHNILAIDNNTKVHHIWPSAHNPQLEKATHLLVFTAWTAIRHENINELIAYIASAKGLSLDQTGDYKEVMKILVKSKAGYHVEWSTKQAYMALGIGLTAAGEQKIDAFPVEHFNREALDEHLNLKDKGMTSIAVLALGKRDGSNEILEKVLTKKPARKRARSLAVRN